MGDLAVSVRLGGVLIEDRTIPVHSLVRIGESPDAAVAFPGADVAVVRLGKRLAVRGRTLEEGEEMEISLGPTEVHLRHVHRFCPPSVLQTRIDTRFLVAALLVMAVGSWIDAAGFWLERQPRDKPAAPIAQILRVVFLGKDLFQGGFPAEDDEMSAAETGAEALTAGASQVPSGRDATSSSATFGDPEGEGPASTAAKADGPRHEPDDELSGMAYYAWYRSAVPRDTRVEEAYERLNLNPEDPAAWRILAQAHYEKDEYELAQWFYERLLGSYPDDTAARIRLARALKRQGFHQEEIRAYDQVLLSEPANVEALAGRAVALARLGYLDRASRALDELQIKAPTHPYTDITVALIEALQGHDAAALDALERGFVARAQLSEELQVELRRDIALDPAFQALRKFRLRPMLSNHLGAAAPRPLN